MTVTSIVRPWSSRPASALGLLRRFPDRLREPAFWWIQAAILAVTVLHIGMEAAQVAANDQGFASHLHHVPVMLYLIPVVAACYRYGMEGGVLTGIWCAVLAVPNMVLWHAEHYEWLGELIFVTVVVAIGLVVATPVEREQTQRRHAEAVARRLAFLNDAAASLSDTPNLTRAIHRALEQLSAVLGLQAAVVVADGTVDDNPLRVVHAPSGDETNLLRTRPGIDEQPGVSVVPVTAHGRRIGHLAVLIEHGRELAAEENAILTAVAGQIGVAVDIAGLHRQEERRLRSYVHRVTRAQEEERQRIARELHDDAVQQLIVLARDLDRVIQACRQPGHCAQLQTVHGHSTQILAGLRRFSRDLRPAMLDELGLVAALEWLTDDLADRTGIEVRFDVDGSPSRLPEEVEVAVFRIAQEAMRNVERHSRATHVGVHVRLRPDEVEGRVVDDGIGFTPPDEDVRTQPISFGILGMQERARLIGGELHIETHPHHGTCVTVCAPTRGQQR